MTIRPVSDTFYTAQQNTAPQKTETAFDKQILLANVTQQQQLTARERVDQAQVSSTPAERERRADALGRTRVTGTQPAPRPSRDRAPMRLDTLEESYTKRAKTPDEALSMRADKIALDDKLVSKLKAGVAKGRNPFTGNDGEVARRAYVDFLSARGMADTPDSRRVFADLLSERKTRLSSSGQPNLGVNGEKQFYADAALARLRARSMREGPIELAPQDRWMISALSEPTVKLTPGDRALLDRTQWHDMGLRRNLGEWAAKQAAASEPQPRVGQPFRVLLNAADVFQGDPQRNAFSMAAKGAGYSDEEINLAAQHFANHDIGLYVDLDQAGEPQITSLDQAKPVTIGGQDFVSYAMDKEGAAVLRDARYAHQHGFDSVDAYRDDFNNSWSDMVGRAGTTWLEFEQARDKWLGFDKAPILGPLARGKYDAIRELTLVGSNSAQFIESFKHTFVRISDSEELMRYYENASAGAEQTFTELGRTYPQEEQGLIAQVARGATGGLPKMAVNVVPGAAVFYNLGKHANHSVDAFAAETGIDLLSVAAGNATGRLATGASGLASKQVNNKLAQAAVKQVVSRGTAGIAGAATNVAADMGPAYLDEIARTDADRANMTDAQKAEAAEKLSMQAFKRNALSGLVFGIVMPGAHQKEDLVTLSKSGASLEGPLFRTSSPEGGERYYGVANVTEGSKTRVAMIEVDPSSPKAQEAIKAGQVKDARQGDVDLALAQSPTAPKAPLPREEAPATGVLTLGGPPEAGEPKPVHERYMSMMRGEMSPERYALETALEVAREVEWYAMNTRQKAADRGLVEPFGTCTRVASDTSIKLSRRRVEHSLAVYDVYRPGEKPSRHAVVELPGGQVVTYSSVFKSMADLQKQTGATYTEVFRGDLKRYIERQSDETRSSMGIVSYPHQYTLEEMIKAQTKPGRQIVANEEGATIPDEETPHRPIIANEETAMTMVQKGAAMPDPAAAKALQPRLDEAFAAYKAGDYQKAHDLLTDRAFAETIGVKYEKESVISLTDLRQLTLEQLNSVTIDARQKSKASGPNEPKSVHIAYAVHVPVLDPSARVESRAVAAVSKQLTPIMLEEWMHLMQNATGRPISKLTLQYLKEHNVQWDVQLHHELDIVAAFYERGLPVNELGTVTQTVGIYPERKSFQDWYLSKTAVTSPPRRRHHPLHANN